MKKICSFIICLSMILSFATTLKANANCTCTNTEKGVIITSGSAEKELSPDTVEVSIAIYTTDNKSMIKATNTNKEIAGKIYTELKNMINPAQNDTIKTVGFNASSLYTYTNGKKNFDKYQVSNNIIVKTKSIDKIGKIIDKAIQLGATNVNSVNFSLSTLDKQKNDLLATATKNAKIQADTIAKALGSYTTGVKYISTNYSNTTTTRNYAMLAKSTMNDAAEGSTTPIEAGTLKVKVTVNAEFYIK